MNIILTKNMPVLGEVGGRIVFFSGTDFYYKNESPIGFFKKFRYHRRKKKIKLYLSYI